MVSAIMVVVLRKSDELWSVERWDIVAISMVDICEGLQMKITFKQNKTKQKKGFCGEIEMKGY